MHLIHGAQWFFDRLNIPSRVSAQKFPTSAQYKMIVQIGLLASANCLYISKLQRVCKFHRITLYNSGDCCKCLS